MNNLILMILTVFIIFQFYNLTNSYSRQEMIIGKNTDSNILNRLWRISTYTERASEYPLGDLDYRSKYSHATGIIGSSVITGGWFYLFLVIIIIFLYFLKIKNQSKETKFLLIYSGFVAYMIPVIWDAHFYEYQVIIILVFISTLMKYDKRLINFNSSIAENK